MRTGRDIKCSAPVTEELLYNIETLFIPTLVKHNKIKLHPLKIICTTTNQHIRTIINNNERGGGGSGVATGLSCGIDSFHAIMNHLDPKYESMKLTHLCTFNTAVSYPGGMGAKINEIRGKRFKLAREIAKELRLPLVEVDTNISSAILTTHADNNTTINFSVILALKKLWKTYYYGSTFNISMFSAGSGGLNDFFLSYCFSDSDLRIYIEGIEKTRPEKVAYAASYPITQKYLSVCALSEVNCGTCIRCVSTLIDLEMAGKLESFREVFDVNGYLKRRHEHLKEICGLYLNKEDLHVVETVEHLLKNIEKL